VQTPCQDFGSVEAVAMEGGGVLGIAYLPALEALIGTGKVRLWAGASAGSLLALLCAGGASFQYIEKILYSTHWSEFGSLRYVPGKVFRLFSAGGFNRSSYMESWIGERLKDLGYGEDATFADIKARTGCNLYIPVTDENTEKPVLFSTEGTPSAKVRRVALASASIPLFWPAVEIDGDLYSDGGLTWNHPIDVFSGIAPDRVVGVRVDSTGEIKEERLASSVNPIQRAIRLVSIARKVANKSHVPQELWSRIICIDTGSFPATKFDLTADDIVTLRSAGHAALRRFLSATA
jgi:predicted acylesterase/phospholipase RssA